MPGSWSNKPLKRFTHGNIQCIIYQRPSQFGGMIFNHLEIEVGVVIRQNNSWFTRPNFTPDEVPLVIELLQKAHEWCAINRTPFR